MVARPDALSHFMYNSDYPTDKIIWVYEGQFTTTNNIDNFYVKALENIGSRTPVFVKGAVTLDNWATSIMIGTTYSRAGKNAALSMSWTNYPASYTGLYFTADFRSYVGKTAKYRLWAVQREDISNSDDYGKNAAISKSKIILDSGINYPRLFKDGVAKSGETIQHNLGHIPYIDYWYNLAASSMTKENAFQGYWSYSPRGYFGGVGAWPTITATNTSITFNKMLVNGNEQRDVYYYYRLYA